MGLQSAAVKGPHLLLCAALALATACAAFLLDSPSASAAEETQPPGPFHKIHVIDFDGTIDGLMLSYVRRRVEAAQAAGADCIVLRIDSFGGRVDHSKSIGDMLMKLPDSIHTVAWVPNKAISGAAFISLACRELLITPAASIGDSQPIDGTPGAKPESLGEKIESPLRTWFTAYAERNGYPVLLAQAMVSAHMEVLRVRAASDGKLYYVRGEDFEAAEDEAELIPGIPKSDLTQVGAAVVRKGELFTITGKQALEYGFVARDFDGKLPENEAQVLAALKAPNAVVHLEEMSFSENASKWLLAISGILSAIVMMGVLVFMWQGPGLMTIVGGIALLLVVLINVTADQINGFPIFLILLGIALLATEILLIPGFGIPGIMGIASMSAGFLFLATGSSLGNTEGLDADTLVSFGLQFVYTAIAGLVVLMGLSRFFPRVGPARRMILRPATAGAPPELLSDEAAPPVGARGRTRSALRPAGSAEFEGRLVDVVSDGSFIEEGAAVRVIAVEGTRVTVGSTADSTAGAGAHPEEEA